MPVWQTVQGVSLLRSRLALGQCQCVRCKVRSELLHSVTPPPRPADVTSCLPPTDIEGLRRFSWWAEPISMERS